MTNGSAENTPLILNVEIFSCAGSMTVPCIRTINTVMPMMMQTEMASRITPTRDDNWMSR
jgi:hypothetical protein